ncbi:MAG: 2-hydroxyacyl-CoA dehydratase [Promethearchaeota archaeon]
MSVLIKDAMQFQSLINLALEFLNGRETLKYLKLTKKKHLIGTVTPTPELIWAAGGIPTYPIRMRYFADEMLMKALDMGKTLFGSNMFSNIIRILGNLDKTNTVENIIHKVIQGIFDRYEEMFVIGTDEAGIPTDECYAIKCLVGMFANKGKNLSSTFLQSIRCSAFEKTYETIANYSPVILIDIPPYDSDLIKEIALEEVHYAVKKISNITGIEITQESLKKAAFITNECKIYAKKILDIVAGDKYPIHPKSMAEFLALIEIAFQDYLSNPENFRIILKSLVDEFESAIRKGNYIDVSSLKKILFTVRFGGWEPMIEDYAYEYGGRLIYADWFLYGFMNQIKTTGDMFENYAKFLQDIAIGFGCDNKAVVKSIVNICGEYNIDGVIYNQMFGCHSLTTAYTRLKKELLKREIPSTMVSFNNIGENLEQTKTRTVALLEILNN